MKKNCLYVLFHFILKNALKFHAEIEFNWIYFKSFIVFKHELFIDKKMRHI